MCRQSTLIIVLVLAASGCTHTQLRRNTVHQALTVGDIHQQQVLNNLAMFVYDPNSLPSFSYPNQSAANVTDTGSLQGSGALGRASAGFLWLSSLGSMFTAQRQALEGFTLNPVNDPRKLELMRCAYQTAISGCRGNHMSEACPDCQTIQKKFYTGDPNGDISTSANGIVTSECLAKDRCWFHYSCKKCLPRNCDCLPMGHHCGVYVWVTPDGRDELTRLTLAILDYALNSAPAPLMKNVSYYIDEYGLPTTQSTAVGQVSATVQVSEQPPALMNMSPGDEVRIEQVIRARLLQVNLALAELEQRLNQRKAQGAGGANGDGAAGNQGGGNQGQGNKPMSGPTDPDSALFTALLAEQQSLQMKLRYLNEQLRIDGLKHPYRPAGPAPAVPSSVLPFQLQLQTLAAPFQTTAGSVQ